MTILFLGSFWYLLKIENGHKMRKKIENGHLREIGKNREKKKCWDTKLDHGKDEQAKEEVTMFTGSFLEPDDFK